MSESKPIRQCTVEEAKLVFSLIRQRMHWMDEKGMDSWNRNHYDTIFPLAYYEQEAKQGRLYAWIDENDKIISAAVLLEEDPRWDSQEPALYVHNFVSDPKTKSVGSQFLEAVEQYAHTLGKRYLRLDSARNNLSLERYYTNLGFVAVGSCQEGEYQGILRQKEIRCQNSENGLE